MSKEYTGDFVKTERTRCDVCKRLIPKTVAAKGVFDAVSGKRLDVCSWKCADKYFENLYQIPLFDNPSSNTGVVLNKEP